MPVPPDILDRVLSLADDDRIELVSVLLDTLENSGDLSDYAAVWKAEIEARSDAVHERPGDLRDADVVLSQARSQFQSELQK